MALSSLASWSSFSLNFSSFPLNFFFRFLLRALALPVTHEQLFRDWKRAGFEVLRGARSG